MKTMQANHYIRVFIDEMIAADTFEYESNTPLFPWSSLNWRS